MGASAPTGITRSQASRADLTVAPPADVSAVLPRTGFPGRCGGPSFAGPGVFRSIETSPSCHPGCLHGPRQGRAPSWPASGIDLGRSPSSLPGRLRPRARSGGLFVHPAPKTLPSPGRLPALDRPHHRPSPSRYTAASSARGQPGWAEPRSIIVGWGGNNQTTRVSLR